MNNLNKLSLLWKSMGKTTAKNVFRPMWIKMIEHRFFFCIYLSRPAVVNPNKEQDSAHGTY